MSSPAHPNHRSEILFAIGILVALAFVYIARDVLLLIYVSALFAVVIGPAIDAIRRIHVGSWRPGRGLSILIIIVAALGLAVLFFTFALPPFFRDVKAFASDLPRRASQLQDKLGSSPLAGELDVESLEAHASAALGGAVGFFTGFFGSIFAFFTAVVLTAYFALDGERAFQWLLAMIAEPQRLRFESTLLRAEVRLRRWLIGQGALMAILGVCATIFFGLIHLKYSYALGVLAGALNIVPVIGPLTALILASLVAAFDSVPKLLAVLGFYLVYQQVENAFLTPRIMKLSVNLPPLAVVVALTLGGAVAGILGALIAVPTAALIAVLADEYLVRKPVAAPSAVKSSGASSE